MPGGTAEHRAHVQTDPTRKTDEGFSERSPAGGIGAAAKKQDLSTPCRQLAQLNVRV